LVLVMWSSETITLVRIRRIRIHSHYSVVQTLEANKSVQAKPKIGPSTVASQGIELNCPCLVSS
jgi:hypothetical protein